MVTVAEYQLAERKLGVRDGRRGWAIHAAVYVTVMIGLIIINLLLVSDGVDPHAGLAENADANFVWFPFPLVGWGVGLSVHYLHGVRGAERSLQETQAHVAEAADQT